MGKWEMRIQVSFLGSWQSVGAEYTETRRKHRDEIVDEMDLK